MKKIAAAALLFAVFGAAAAIAGPHEDREALMKQNGAAMKALNGIATAASFDAAAAKAQTQILVDNAGKIPGLFAPGSEMGDPHALPNIWTDAAGFKAVADKFGADAMTAQNATDGTSLAAALKTVQGDCGGCHKTYRAPPAAKTVNSPVVPAPAQ
jgi:cytochrome c556